jgi:hypothetical protein
VHELVLDGLAVLNPVLLKIIFESLVALSLDIEALEGIGKARENRFNLVAKGLPIRLGLTLGDESREGLGVSVNFGNGSLDLLDNTLDSGELGLDTSEILGGVLGELGSLGKPVGQLCRSRAERASNSGRHLV